MGKHVWWRPCVWLGLVGFLWGGGQLAGADPVTGQTETVMLPGDIALDLLWFPAGSFEMGQNPGEQDAYSNKEWPRHAVTVSRGFWMGKYEVTKAQWQAVMGTAPWSVKKGVGEDPQTPAVCITWPEAVAFAEKLGRDTGKTFRLPTEAEWEYACRAGTTTRFYWGDDPNYEAIQDYAWWRGNTIIAREMRPQPVGGKRPNPWGLFDMGGNVSEWCQDWHSFYPDYTVTDPVGPNIADHRVLRGGSWMDTGGRCRSARRNHEEPGAVFNYIGFRVACGPAPAPQPGAPEFTNVFTAGLDGVNTYRIPAMLLGPDNSLQVFCEARKESEQDASPTDMVLKRSLDGGRTWLPTQTLVHGVGAEALMNPCPVVDRETNTIILLCNNINKLGPDHHQHFMLTSKDNGQTWSEPVDLKPHVSNYDATFVPGPGVGIQLKSGRLFVPGYAGNMTEESEENYYSCGIYSDDHGKTWTMSPRVPELTDESQAVELKNGDVMLNMRGNMGMSCRGVAISKNGGESWDSLYWDRALNECPCQGSIIRYSFADQGGKDRILFANPDNTGELFNVVERTKLTVRMSYDEGKTWPVKKLVHGGPSAYSTMVRLPDGDIGILFEGGEKHRREWIRFARFSLAWLTDGADKP